MLAPHSPNFYNMKWQCCPSGHGHELGPQCCCQVMPSNPVAVEGTPCRGTDDCFTLNPSWLKILILRSVKVWRIGCLLEYHHCHLFVTMVQNYEIRRQ
ncbi:hypothetical protein TNCV_341741 [Trichonephila clavipes]|nr:hypothetical protein TNCV_341741 [Trichonephila clavipes]